MQNEPKINRHASWLFSCTPNPKTNISSNKVNLSLTVVIMILAVWVLLTRIAFGKYLLVFIWLITHYPSRCRLYNIYSATKQHKLWRVWFQYSNYNTLRAEILKQSGHPPPPAITLIKLVPNFNFNIQSGLSSSGLFTLSNRNWVIVAQSEIIATETMQSELALSYCEPLNDAY